MVCCEWGDGVAVKRRDVLKGAAAGALAIWAPGMMHGQQAAQPGVTRLTEKLGVIDAGGANVTAFVTGEGLVVVDSGAPNTGEAVMAALKSLAPNAKVTTLFNTHYHLDQ